MVHRIAVDAAPGRIEPPHPAALLQVVDPVLYDLDAAVAWFVEADASPSTTAPMIEAALLAIEDAVARVNDQTDLLELAAIAEQLPIAPTTNIARRATELGALMLEHETIETARDAIFATQRGRRLLEEIDGTARAIDLDLARRANELEHDASRVTERTKACCRSIAASALASIVPADF